MQIPINTYGSNINVTYTDGAAHITNDSLLVTALSAYGSHDVANSVKIYYERTLRKALNVGTTSMAIEINGHVYPDKVCKIILNSPIVAKSIKDQIASIAKSTSVIDTGEYPGDHNRKLWDVLATLAISSTLLF
ncbi:hypothetical protein [Clostridium tagluense]|uniref:hypothetical protein n=1 Tax=Clostridium tagluense TaxID=360422 RepID=UPI001C6F28F3|nr:hypothetical protein [Clostridium tagluense]MBW9159464.1 hypothetical protein [Clostridium tagluense]WLC68472.1 hypothetical protein KTC93_25500 [Clostridium tagluense]